LFSVCCALRLARFNTMIGEPDLPPYAYNYFTGIPAPAAAGLALLPLILAIQFGDGIFSQPGLVAVVLLGVSFLMVSKIPTYSFKKIRVPHKWVMPILLLVGLLAAFLVTEPWLTLAVVGLLYLASIPWAVASFRRLKAQAEQMADPAAPSSSA
jgi:CDP-diacylglycerol--serine O-phosphatidyltransferase